MLLEEQGRKRPLDTPKRMIERRRERKNGRRRDIEREGEIRERGERYRGEWDREVKGIER
jgi:hypothetical protein